MYVCSRERNHHNILVTQNKTKLYANMIKLYTILATIVGINELFDFIKLNRILGDQDNASFVGTHELDPSILFVSFHSKKLSNLPQIKDDFVFMSCWVGITKLYLSCLLLTTGWCCRDYMTRAICSMVMCISTTICYVTLYDQLMKLQNIDEITNDKLWMKYNLQLTIQMIAFGIATFQEIVLWSGDPITLRASGTDSNDNNNKKKDD